MPGIVRGAVSVGVLPFSVSTHFEESHSVQAIQNEYHGGEYQTAAQVIQPRRSWKLTKRLTPSQIVTLRTFFDAHPADAFYFYNPTETSPLFSWDVTGVATAGRYLVRFGNDWSQSMGIARGDLPLDLIEVGADDDTGQGLGGVANNGRGLGTATLHIWSALTNNGFSPGGRESVSYSQSGITGWRSPFSVWGAVINSGAPHALAHATATFSIFDVTQFCVRCYPWATLPTNPADTDLDIYDCWLAVNFADGSTANYRPSAYSTYTPSGTITNPMFAFDVDPATPTTFANINGIRFNGFTDPCILLLTNFIEF